MNKNIFSIAENQQLTLKFTSKDKTIAARKYISMLEERYSIYYFNITVKKNNIKFTVPAILVEEILQELLWNNFEFSLISRVVPV